MELQQRQIILRQSGPELSGRLSSFWRAVLGMMQEECSKTLKVKSYFWLFRQHLNAVGVTHVPPAKCLNPLAA